MRVYDVSMPVVTACLLDVYETILTCDFAAHLVELPQIARVSVDDWGSGYLRFGPAVTDGRLTLAEAFSMLLADAGADAGPDVVAALVRRNQELLLQTARLFEDTIPFMTMLHDLGIRVALVSNCAEDTRALVEHVGLSSMVDAMVLSCEVGHAKPSAAIFERALAQLDVTPQAAMFVDDQARFCDGAAMLGIRAVQIIRDAPARTSESHPHSVITGLAELSAMLGAQDLS
ncbi:MAG: HAD-superfamily hydrolase, subfamily variant 3 [Ilumatobacteraceae bacterium]|nr:HAD-superfamily hydrolase, subfamily variant 3 [Ilumatobacteraceae bacterium]